MAVVKEDDCQQQSCTVEVHSLPFLTSFRGTTDVKENFSRHTTRSECGELRNTFRGRVLVGRELVLPPTYGLVCAAFAGAGAQRQVAGAAGRVVATAPTAQVESAAEDVHITGTTDRFCLWGHDKPLERPDALLQWIELSHAVHIEP